MAHKSPKHVPPLSEPQWFEVTFRISIQKRGDAPTDEDAETYVQHIIDGWEEPDHLVKDDAVNFRAQKVNGP